jgi:predicted Fe-Mo cluster-binding NifX family protein
MILCMPVEKAEGEASRIHGHFGSASCFLLFDTEKGTYETVKNTNAQHSHGQCHPMENLTGRNVGVVLCRGMGRRAVERLREGGVKVLVGETPTAGEAIKAYQAGGLSELTPEEACSGHGHNESGGQCDHKRS